MAEFPLTNTASDIDVALQKVVGITSTPTAGNSNTVTSGGVYAALQSLNHTNMDAGFLVTETEGIDNNDTDTQVPTCAAVASYVASYLGSSNLLFAETYTATTNSGRAGYTSSTGPNFPFVSSTNGLVISSGSVVVPTTGDYVMIWQQYARDDNGSYRIENNTSAGTIVRYKRNGSVLFQSNQNPTGSEYLDSNQVYKITREKANVVSLNAGDTLIGDVRRINSGDEINWNAGTLTLKLVTPFYTQLVNAGF